ncbi:hypothetical protein [Stagnihabitans tardus]|uniref:Uncharacterized protein n=1 Tax=Stagnihabitans tardus TaxID=2699202 RepID=A0AAE5BWJ0_9RHOB|nr:hypothetical protein [Stagnihabitans tardus]NBZ90066.1 hypothetical protein [Stagnihabitans tardus]
MMKRIGTKDQIADLEEFAVALLGGMGPEAEHAECIRRLAEEARQRAKLLQILRVFEDV